MTIDEIYNDLARLIKESKPLPSLSTIVAMFKEASDEAVAEAVKTEREACLAIVAKGSRACAEIDSEGHCDHFYVEDCLDTAIRARGAK